jgi:hypothetical protein
VDDLMMCAVEGRQFERKIVRETVSACWLNPQGVQKFYSTYCFEVSANGLSILMAEPIQVNSYVALRSAKLKLAGRAVVRNCVRRNSGYRVGLEFAAETPIDAVFCK